MEHNKYVPVLKSKLGEFNALKLTSSLTRSSINPLLEVINTQWDFEHDRPAKQLEVHLNSIVKNLSKSWGNNPIFIDSLIKDDTFMNDGKTHHLNYLFNGLNNSGVNPIPVTSTVRNKIFNNTLKNIIENTSNGYCLRLTLKEINNPDFKKELDNILSFFKIDCSNIDLIIDLESIYSTNISSLSNGLIVNINSFPYLASWKSFTLVSGAFPLNLSGIKGNSTSTIERKDWNLWNALRISNSLDRIPIYGDYSIAHPQMIDLDPRIITVSPSIRYTTNADWLVVKGLSAKIHSFEQYHDLSYNLTLKPEYYGENFSSGDKIIKNCATRSSGPGNSTTWRTVANNHHFELVTEQVSNLTLI